MGAISFPERIDPLVSPYCLYRQFRERESRIFAFRTYALIGNYKNIYSDENDNVLERTLRMDG